jgi:hypothetical protein
VTTSQDWLHVCARSSRPLAVSGEQPQRLSWTGFFGFLPFPLGFLSFDSGFGFGLDFGFGSAFLSVLSDRPCTGQSSGHVLEFSFCSHWPFPQMGQS